MSRPLAVRGSLPIEVQLQAGPAVTETVVVRGDAGTNTAEHSWSISGDRLLLVGGHGENQGPEVGVRGPGPPGDRQA